MPFSNNPDRFFISGGDYNVFLGLIKELRESLLSLNRYNPGNESSIFDIEVLKKFVQLRIIAYNYKTLNEYQKEQSDINLKAFQSNTMAISDAVKRYNEQESDLNDATVNEILTNGERVDSIFSRVSDQIFNELKTKNRISDSDYQINKDNDSANRNDYGYTKKILTNPSSTSSNPDDAAVKIENINFPNHGKPWNNGMDKITNFMNNTSLFYTKGNKKIFKGWVKIDKNGNETPDARNTFTPLNPLSEQINDTLKRQFGQKQFSAPGTYKFFIEKLHGRYSDGSPYKKQPIRSQIEQTGNLNLTNRMVFSAYVDDFSESYTASKSEYNFIGRGEAIPIHKSTSREINLTFSIVADYSIDLLMAMEMLDKTYNSTRNLEYQIKEILKNRQDWGLGTVGIPKVFNDGRLGGHIPGMYSDTPETLWLKLTFLAQCMYPYYRNDGKMKEQPLIRIRVADMHDLVCKINTLNFNNSEFDNMIDLNPSTIGHIPFATKVTMGMTVIHDNEPSSNFFGFFNRKEFDDGTMDSATGQEISRQGVTFDGVKKDSPTDFFSKYANEGLLDAPKELQQNFKLFKKDLDNFKSNFNELKKIGSSISDRVRKSKAEKAMKAYTRVLEVANQLAPQLGLDPISAGGQYSISDITKKVGEGDLTGAFDAAKNTVKTAKSDIKNLKDKFDDVYGNVMDMTVNVANTVNVINQDLRLVGVNVIKNDTVENTVKAVNKLKLQNSVPKTLGDIFGK